jgi:hypothetical protein
VEVDHLGPPNGSNAGALLLRCHQWGGCFFSYKSYLFLRGKLAMAAFFDFSHHKKKSQCCLLHQFDQSDMTQESCMIEQHKSELR